MSRQALLRLLFALLGLLAVAAAVVGTFRYHFGYWPLVGEPTRELAVAHEDGLGGRDTNAAELVGRPVARLMTVLGDPAEMDLPPTTDTVYFSYYRWDVGLLEVVAMVPPGELIPEFLVFRPTDRRIDFDGLLALCGIDRFDADLEVALVETRLYRRYSPAEINGLAVRTVTFWKRPGERSLVIVPEREPPRE